MSKVLTGITIIILSVFIIVSCSKSSGTGGTTNNGGGGGGGGTTVDCSTVNNKAFSANVDPIIQASCNISGCHAAGSVNGPGPLTNYTQVFNARTTIRAAVLSGFMPQNSTLTSAQKNTIACWIDSGAPNN